MIVEDAIETKEDGKEAGIHQEMEVAEEASEADHHHEVEDIEEAQVSTLRIRSMSPDSASEPQSKT